jgi:hypothetical protein
LLLAALELAAVITLLVPAIRESRVSNLLSYFTIESNVLAAVMLTVTAVTVLRGGSTLGRTLTLWRGLATFSMVATGIIYVALLRNVDVQTGSQWTNTVLHYLMPVVLLVDWLITPRARIALLAAAWWLVFPLLYLAYSLIRGPIVDWYPYPFLDLRIHSGGTVAITGVVLAVGMAVLAAVLTLLPSPRNERELVTTDRRL